MTARHRYEPLSRAAPRPDVRNRAGRLTVAYALITSILVQRRFTLGKLQIGPSLMTAAESCPTSPWIALAHRCGNGLSAPLAALVARRRRLRCKPLGSPQVYSG